MLGFGFMPVVGYMPGGAGQIHRAGSWLCWWRCFSSRSSGGRSRRRWGGTPPAPPSIKLLLAVSFFVVKVCGSSSVRMVMRRRSSSCCWAAERLIYGLGVPCRCLSAASGGCSRDSSLSFHGGSRERRTCGQAPSISAPAPSSIPSGFFNFSWPAVVARGARREAGRWLMVELLVKLQSAKGISNGDDAPLLLQANGATSRLGAGCSDGSSSSRPLSQSGGSSSTSARRPSSSASQVVSSPVMCSVAGVLRFNVVGGVGGLDRVSIFFLRSFLEVVRAWL